MPFAFQRYDRCSCTALRLVTSRSPLSGAVFAAQIETQLGLGTYRWWEEEELRELSAVVGLQNFQRHRTGRFILFSVTKPNSAP